MKQYYVSTQTQSNGDNEVHTDGCTFMPLPLNRINLGEHSSCTTAVVAARKYYRQVNGCKYCCNACHTQ